MAEQDVAVLERFVADTCTTHEWKLFIDCLPYAVADTPDKRHKYQTEFLNMMAQALQQSRNQAEAGGNTVRESLEIAKAELETRKRKAEEANIAKDLAMDAFQNSTSRLSEARAAVREAVKCHKPADKENLHAMAKKANAQKQRDQAAATSEGPLAMLRCGGSGNAAEYDDAIDRVAQLLKTIPAENTLISASVGTFRTMPEKRRRFDTIVETGVVEVINKYITELDNAFEHSAALAENAEAEALGLWAICDCARDKVQEIEKELDEARAAQQGACTHAAAAEAEVIEQQKTVEDAASHSKLQSEKMQRHDVVMEALGRLQRDEYAVCNAEPSAENAEIALGVIVDKSFT